MVFYMKTNYCLFEQTQKNNTLPLINDLCFKVNSTKIKYMTNEDTNQT